MECQKTERFAGTIRTSDDISNFKSGWVMTEYHACTYNMYTNVGCENA